MKRVAFVFTSAPHGSASGREGLDALLATSALTEDIGVFFLGDGVFQLLAGPTASGHPGARLHRDLQSAAALRYRNQLCLCRLLNGARFE